MGFDRFWGKTRPNPFSPTFGGRPSELVGRDYQIEQICAGLASGPSDPKYLSILLGSRGTGKTALLNEIGELAEKNGWILVRIPSPHGGLAQLLDSAIGDAINKYENLDSASAESVSTERTLSVNLGAIKGQWSKRRTADSPTTFSTSLRNLAEIVQAAGTSALLHIDELHAIDRQEARVFFSELQYVTNVDKQPVAFLGACLPEAKTTLLADEKNTFLQRCIKYNLPALNNADALRGLRVPIHSAGGNIEIEPLKAAAQAVNGSPYRLQMIGYNAWAIAGAPETIIDMDTVNLAIAEADKQTEDNISLPSWYDLSTRDRELLQYVAESGGISSIEHLAKSYRVLPKDLSDQIRRLEVSEHIHVENGTVSLTGRTIPAELISKLANKLGTASTSNPLEPHETHRYLDPAKNPNRCNNWMPLAKAKCVLRTGHSGRCRSK